MISFVIPAYNEVSSIVGCILSIKKDAYTGKIGIPYEIIVVDNNSTDNTAEVALTCQVTVIKELRKGTSWARQAGLEAAKYDFVAFIDADSQISEGWVDLAYETLFPEDVVAVSGPHFYFELPLTQRVLIFIVYCFAKALHAFWPTINGGNFIVKKKPFLDVGGFDTSIAFHGDDTAVARRISTQGKIKFKLDMFDWSSSRRFQAEGLFKTGLLYILNYAWVWATGHPFSKRYNDVRL